MIKGDNFVFRQSKKDRRKCTKKLVCHNELIYRSEEYSISMPIKKINDVRNN